MSVEKFGRQLKVALAVRGLSYWKTAAALGLTKSTIQWWASGRLIPAPSNAENLLEFLIRTPLLSHIPHYPYFYLQHSDIPSRKSI